MRWLAPSFALSIGLTLLVLSSMHRIDGRIDQIPVTVSLELPNHMTRRTTSWTSALGAESVTTEKAENETSAAWATRHRNEVVAAQLLDPPI